MFRNIKRQAIYGVSVTGTLITLVYNRDVDSKGLKKFFVE